MTRREDPWRLPALEQFGAQLRDAERADPRRQARRPGGWRPFPVRIGAVIVMLALIAGVLDLVSPAGALSPVNRAPLAAEHSRSVRFASVQVITLNGRRVSAVRETGQLNFATGAFATTLTIGDTHEPIERRRLGGVFYLGLVGGRGKQAGRERWSATRVGREGLGSFSLPGGYTLIDPEVVFRVLTDASSPVAMVGHEEIAGARTTHYWLTTNLDAFLAAEKGQSAKSVPHVSPAATLDVWLDTRGRPVRVAATFIGSSGPHGAKMTTVVDFADYGAPAIVRAPPRSAISPRGTRTPPLGDPARAAERLLSLTH